MRTVINQRHESEIEDFDERAVVTELDLAYENPAFGGPGELTDEVLDRTLELLREAERPILMHCNSGNRTGAAWMAYRALDDPPGGARSAGSARERCCGPPLIATTLVHPVGAGGAETVSRTTKRLERGAGRLVVLACLTLAVAGCAPSGDSLEPSALATDGRTLHLEEHLDRALIEGCQPPAELPESLSWSFDREQPEWDSMLGGQPPEGTESAAPKLERLDDALRVHLATPDDEGDIWGLVYVELPDLRRSEWSEVRVRVRTSEPIEDMGIAFDRRAEADADEQWEAWGEEVAIIADGEPHLYRLRADWSESWSGEYRDPWSELALWFAASKAAHVDLLSVELLPKALEYAQEPVGVCSLERGGLERRAIHVYAPGKLGFRLQVPEEAALHLGLGVQSASQPVTFRVLVHADSGPARGVLEETWADDTSWLLRSVDLSSFAGRSVGLSLEVDGEQPGAVAFWAAPTLSGRRRDPSKPNVILYVIDGGGADLMSVYGYNRATTPVMEKLAQEGVVFEYAHTNSGWTKPSTASFMTSLHHSVLGGFTSNNDQIPARAITMAQHFHRAGYQTAVFTSNPFALTLSGLQREVDVFRDHGAEHNSGSSEELHRLYWTWREEYPGEPFWVHFQTTDVHEPHEPVSPFAGLFVTPERRARFHEWWRAMRRADAEPADTILGRYLNRLKAMGVDPREFFDIQRGLYDETMAHNDFQLGQLVERIKARGEWERTLLIIAADHGHPAGSFSRFGRGLIEPTPDDFEGALADSYRTRIPLIVIWPGHIPPGRRVTDRVSMIDLLPTVLDLVHLPEASPCQGQSLVPLLQGTQGWAARPIVFDQFQADLGSRELAGHVEVVDGRWAASLEIVPPSLEAEYRAGRRPLRTSGSWRTPRPHRPSTPRLLLYDLWNDRFCTQNVNAEHPELVEKYTALLEAQWQAHRALAQHFEAEAEESAMTAEQLRALRTLGYVK